MYQCRKDPRQQAFAYECLAASLDAGYVPLAVGEIVKNDAMAVMDQSTLSKTHHKQEGQSGGRRSAMNEAVMECAWPDMVAGSLTREWMDGCLCLGVCSLIHASIRFVCPCVEPRCVFEP